MVKTIKITKKKIITVGVLTAILVTGTFAGAQVANSAGETVMPVEMTAFRAPENAGAEAPSLFDSESAMIGISADSTTTASAPASGKLVISRKNDGPAPIVTTFKPTEQCPGKLGVKSLSISGNGNTIVFKATGSYFSCLTGLTGPEHVDERERAWALRYKNNVWEPQLVESSTPGFQTLSPATNGLGDEIVYATDKALYPEAISGANNVYAKNLDTGQVQLISYHDASGSNGVAFPQANSSFNNSHVPNKKYELKMSISGRYVGWMTKDTANYTSRMLADEAGNSISNVAVVDRMKQDAQGVWGKARPVGVPSLAAAGGAGKRLGHLLGFKESSNGDQIVYNSYSLNGVTLLNVQTTFYDITNQKLYAIPEGERFMIDLAHDGKSGVSAVAYHDGPVAWYDFKDFVHYTMKDDFGVSGAEISRIHFNVVGNAVDIKVSQDKVIIAGRTQTWEIPK